jgi:hypothetical protein
MSEETYTVIGTAQSPNGMYKVRWTNDLISHYKRIHRQGCKNIEFFETPEPMNKLEALEWMINNHELTGEAMEVAFIKKMEKLRSFRKSTNTLKTK